MAENPGRQEFFFDRGTVLLPNVFWHPTRKFKLRRYDPDTVDQRCKGIAVWFLPPYGLNLT